MPPALSLARRELVRFLRQRSRVIGALVTPVVFWLLIGFGVGNSFVMGGGGYSTYFFPGTILMIVLFTAIFSTISVIEDRRDGFLQGVLVAPVSRLDIVMGKVLGGTALASFQATLFLLAAPWVGVPVTPLSFLAAVAVIVFCSIGITALGFVIAWPLSSTQGFHAIMNLLLMPMWFLSGALFPLRDDTPLPMRVLMTINPMTWCLDLLRSALRGDVLGHLPGVGAVAIFVVTMIGLSLIVTLGPTRRQSA